MDLFPYSPRPGQDDLVTTVRRTLEGEADLVVESGTGTGKTVCALAGALQVALAKGRKVVYLTRTNSQQRQVILELREINRMRGIFGMGMQGRQGICPMVLRDPELRKGTPEELSKLCGERKRRTLAGREGGCRFYDRTVSTSFEEIASFCSRELPTVEEFVSYCDSRSLCPYELMKELAQKATLVTAPYAFFFAPFIRSSLLEWMNVPLEEVIVIVDEAHNLPDYAREIKSFSLSERLLEMVEGEVESYGDPELVDGVSIIDIVTSSKEALEEAVGEYLIEDDGLLPPSFLEERLMDAFSITSHTLSIISKALLTHGEIVRERRKEEGRLPRSYIHSLGAFLEIWMGMDQEYYVRLVLGGENPALQGYCLDPSLATSFLRNCAGTLHMSATLSPLNEYRDSIGLPEETLLRTFPSPFPEGNRLILYTEEATTRYEELTRDGEMVRLLEEKVVALCNALGKNTVVFFPSYSLMRRFLLDGVLGRIRRRVHVEERGMSQSELMETVGQFKDSQNGSVLFAVMGGRVSEGLDFPSRELEVVILVGIPYPKPTARQRALLHYYEMKFGRGWEYTVKAPACRKMLQAIGRLIRTEEDVGAAIILDRRAVQFSSAMEVVRSDNLVGDVSAFFDSRQKST